MARERSEVGKRSAAAIRRNGWDVAHVKRAVATLAAMLPSTARSADEALASELLRWLATHPDIVQNATNYDTTGAIAAPDHLVAVAHVLGTADEASVLPMLRKVCADPDAALIELLDDMETEDLASPGPTDLVVAAVRALAELGTIAGMRCLFSLLEAEFLALSELIHSSLSKTPDIVGVTLALWDSVDPYARQILIDALSVAGHKDERIATLLVTWIDSDENPMDAAFAASDYRDPQLAPHLHASLARAIDRRDSDAREIAASLEDMGDLREEERKAMDVFVPADLN